VALLFRVAICLLRTGAERVSVCSRLFVAALLLGLTTPLAGQKGPRPDTLAVTTAAVTIRAQPLVNAQALGTLPARTQVRLRACAGGWCSVSNRQLAGYVLEEYLSRTLAQATLGQARGFVNPQARRPASPTRTADNQPPAGATAQCRDGSYSFSQHRSGTCSHHGGVARWL